jgi:hypothetical protein
MSLAPTKTIHSVATNTKVIPGTKTSIPTNIPTSIPPTATLTRTLAPTKTPTQQPVDPGLNLPVRYIEDVNVHKIVPQIELEPIRKIVKRVEKGDET